MRTDAELAKVGWIAREIDGGFTPEQAAASWEWADSEDRAGLVIIAAAVRLAVVTDLAADLGDALNPGRAKQEAKP